MADEHVTRAEFDALKEGVKEIRKEVDNSKEIMQSVDKKVDIIMEKVLNSKEAEDLKLEPMKDRISKLEDSQKWLRRTVISELIGVITAAVVFTIKNMN